MLGLPFLFIYIYVIYHFVIIPIKRKFTKINFANKTVWITGASSGLGEAMAIQLAKAGANLILTSRNEKELNRVKELCKDPNNVQILPMDMSKPYDIIEQTKKFINQYEQQGKKIDIIIENAGISMRSNFSEYEYDNHEQMTNLNYNGPVAHAKAYLSHFIKNQSGQIVIVSSIAGKLGPGLRTSYCGSKGGVAGFFDSLRSEVRDHNIFITNLYPGYVKTNLSINAQVGKKGEKLGKTDENIATGMDADEFAKQALYFIQVKQCEAIIAKDFKSRLGVVIKNLFPDLFHKLLYKNVKTQREAVEKAK